MTMKCTTGRPVSLCLAILVLAIATLLSSCGATNSFDYHTPKFLVAVNSSAGANFEVFPVNSTTGALGAAVSGSPFDLAANLDDPYAVATHPTHGNWVYACDWNNDPVAKVVAVKIGDDGKPTVINTADTSTNYGCDYTFSMTITPNGKYLYTADYSSTNVSMFAIDQTDGHLTGLGTSATGLFGSADAVAASNDYVFANNGSDQIAALKINSDGKLSCPTSGCPITTADTEFSAMGVDRTGKYLFAGTADTETTAARLYSYSIGTNGALTALTASPLTLTNAVWIGQVSVSIDNKFIYLADGGDKAPQGVYAFSLNADNGSLTAVSGAPYRDSTGCAASVSVDPSNGFVYSSDNWEDIFGWKRDQTTGALTPIGAADAPLTNSAIGNVTAVSITF